MSGPEFRQAVVLIHGIGEQRPMDTLRGFANAILEKRNDEHPKFWSRPDLLNDTLELRTLTSVQTGNRPRTDYYEYYWAYLMTGTSIRHVLHWLTSLFLRRPADVPPRLRFLWWASWTLFLAAAVLFVKGILPAFGHPSPWEALEKKSIALSAAVSLTLSFLNFFTLYYIGDAARYLNPEPENISIRHDIRQEGINLLKKLHESKLYDRIVVVGHSLGSVIGYDILKYCWAELSAADRTPALDARPILRELEETGAGLHSRPPLATVEEFRKKQNAFWVQERRAGKPWLVTDFITAGSPLAHAELLLASGRTDLESRKTERELPTCPPVGQREGGLERYSYVASSGDPEARLLNHAALFGPTRWTNLYFPGDLVAGPLRPVLGDGIRDICVTRPGFVSSMPWSHVRYWTREPGAKPTEAAPEHRRYAVEDLLDALGLNSHDLIAATREKNPAPAAGTQA